jgi:hypothetical protein
MPRRGRTRTRKGHERNPAQSDQEKELAISLAFEPEGSFEDDIETAVLIAIVTEHLLGPRIDGHHLRGGPPIRWNGAETHDLGGVPLHPLGSPRDPPAVRGVPDRSRTPHPGGVADTARELDHNSERVPDLSRPHPVHPVRHWDLDGRLAIILNSKVRTIDDSALNRLNLGILREETTTSAGHRDRIESSREAIRSRGGSRLQNTQIPEWGSPEWDRPVVYADSAESIAADLRVTERRVSEWRNGEQRIQQERWISEWPLRGQSEISAARINPPRLAGIPRYGPEIQGEAERRSGVRHRFNSPADPWFGNLTRQDRRRVELGLWAPQEHARTVTRRQWTRLWIWFNRWACRIPHRVDRPLRHPDPDHPSHIGIDRTHPRLSDSHRGPSDSPERDSHYQDPVDPSASGSTGTPTIRSAHRNYRLRNQALSRSYAVLRNSTTEPDTGTSDPTEEAALIAALLASLGDAPQIRRSTCLTWSQPSDQLHQAINRATGVPSDQASLPIDPGRASSSDQVPHQGGSGSTLPQIPEVDDTRTSERGDRTNLPLEPSVPIPESGRARGISILNESTWGAYTTPDRTGAAIRPRRGSRGGATRGQEHRDQRPRHG